MKDFEQEPALIRPDLVWPLKKEEWKRKNDIKAIIHYMRSSISVKLIFMNLWTRNTDERSIRRPILILEDDISFPRLKDETLSIVQRH